MAGKYPNNGEDALSNVEDIIRGALQEIASRRRVIIPRRYQDLQEVCDGFSNMTNPKTKAHMKLYEVSNAGGVVIGGSELKIDEDGMKILTSILPKCSTFTSSLCVDNTIDIAVTVQGVRRELTPEEIAACDNFEDDDFLDEGSDPEYESLFYNLD